MPKDLKNMLKKIGKKEDHCSVEHTIFINVNSYIKNFKAICFFNITIVIMLIFS